VIPYSLLDLSPIPEGGKPADALANTLDLAQHAEGWGYQRFWLAEHHNMTGIASAATAIVIGYVAGGTKRIRVGAGGIMLPNHAPLVVAEAFGTLATLYPDRIDLGLGRAPGTDMQTMRALRRNGSEAENFPRDVVELLGYFGDEREGLAVQAVPGTGTKVPVWILGSSTFGAQLAAKLGLPYAFASHFAPGALDVARRLYRDGFEPSAYLKKPHFMLAVNIFAGRDDAEGEFLKSSMQLAFANLRLGRPGPLPKPIEDVETLLGPALYAGVEDAMTISAVGSKDSVSAALKGFVAAYQPDELILTGHIFDHSARLRSFEIAAECLNDR
jgi:luciferase family oxidoreductase group 1